MLPVDFGFDSKAILGRGRRPGQPSAAAAAAHACPSRAAASDWGNTFDMNPRTTLL
jgi:hypothetical protein